MFLYRRCISDALNVWDATVVHHQSEKRELFMNYCWVGARSTATYTNTLPQCSKALTLQHEKIGRDAPSLLP